MKVIELSSGRGNGKHFAAKKSCKLSLFLRGFLETFTARKFLKFLVNKNDFLIHDFKVVKIGFLRACFAYLLRNLFRLVYMNYCRLFIAK